MDVTSHGVHGRPMYVSWAVSHVPRAEHKHMDGTLGVYPVFSGA